MVCVTDSVVYHVGGGTLPKENPRKTYLNFRNNLTMLFKNLPERELRSVMHPPRRGGAPQVCPGGDWASARAVWRARRDYRAWRDDFLPDRRNNLAHTRLDPIPERCTRSLLWAFFFKGQRTFSQFLPS